FTATKLTYSLSGRVTLSGAGLQGVTVALSGASLDSTRALSSANYAFTELANGSYTITPSLSAYSFNPTSSAQVVSGANVTGINRSEERRVGKEWRSRTLSGAG